MDILDFLTKISTASGALRSFSQFCSRKRDKYLKILNTVSGYLSDASGVVPDAGQILQDLTGDKVLLEGDVIMTVDGSSTRVVQTELCQDIYNYLLTISQDDISYNLVDELDFINGVKLRPVNVHPIDGELSDCIGFMTFMGELKNQADACEIENIAATAMASDGIDKYGYFCNMVRQTGIDESSSYANYRGECLRKSRDASEYVECLQYDIPEDAQDFSLESTPSYLTTGMSPLSFLSTGDIDWGDNLWEGFKSLCVETYNAIKACFVLIIDAVKELGGWLSTTFVDPVDMKVINSDGDGTVQGYYAKGTFTPVGYTDAVNNALYTHFKTLFQATDGPCDYWIEYDTLLFTLRFNVTNFSASLGGRIQGNYVMQYKLIDPRIYMEWIGSQDLEAGSSETRAFMSTSSSQGSFTEETFDEDSLVEADWDAFARLLVDHNNTGSLYTFNPTDENFFLSFIGCKDVIRVMYRSAFPSSSSFASLPFLTNECTINGTITNYTFSRFYAKPNSSEPDYALAGTPNLIAIVLRTVGDFATKYISNSESTPYVIYGVSGEAGRNPSFAIMTDEQNQEVAKIGLLTITGIVLSTIAITKVPGMLRTAQRKAAAKNAALQQSLGSKLANGQPLTKAEIKSLNTAARWDSTLNGGMPSLSILGNLFSNNLNSIRYLISGNE